MGRRQTTCFGTSRAPGTSVSRGVRGNTLARVSERLTKKRRSRFGVKFAHNAGMRRETSQEKICDSSNLSLGTFACAYSVLFCGS
jgi:hypothetical protein